MMRLGRQYYLPDDLGDFDHVEYGPGDSATAFYPDGHTRVFSTTVTDEIRDAERRKFIDEIQRRGGIVVQHKMTVEVRRKEWQGVIAGWTE